MSESASAAVRERGRCLLAVSGGRTPWEMLTAIGHEDMPWSETTLYQVDERIAPEGGPDRNLTHLRGSLPAAAFASLAPMPVDEDDLDAAAAAYAATLPEHLDLIHLGLGPDGHTASLLPGDPVLDVIDRDVALTREYQGRRRMTLTYRPLDNARAILWLVTGADKADALARLLAGDESIPAGRIANRNQLIVADAAAAGQ